jgi:transcription elongation factor Elf1
MPRSSSRLHTTAALLDVEPDVVRYPTCPMCHAATSLTPDAIDAGGDWRCGRCGQHWDAVRLATVAAYATWVVAHEPLGRRGRQSSQDAPP